MNTDILGYKASRAEPDKKRHDMEVPPTLVAFFTLIPLILGACFTCLFVLIVLYHRMLLEHLPELRHLPFGSTSVQNSTEI